VKTGFFSSALLILGDSWSWLIRIEAKACASSVLKWHLGASGGFMPAAKKQKQDGDELRPEYDFSRGVRGKYAASIARDTNVVVLAPDVAAAFKTSKAVNDALRALKRKPASKARRPTTR
jgi:hypothetical protein